MVYQRRPLLESAAAVLAVGLAALLTALPSDARSGGSHNLELQDRLSLIRTAVFRFSIEHEAGGYSLPAGQDDSDLLGQLTGRSRRDGSTLPAASGQEDRWFGPYLDRVPVNPVNELATVRLMPAGVTDPVLNGTAGWVYVPATGRVVADLPGLDEVGVPYARY